MSKHKTTENEEHAKKCSVLHAKLDEANREERRLSRQVINLEVTIHNLTIERQTLFQALYDLQKERKVMADRVKELEAKQHTWTFIPEKADQTEARA